MPATKRSPAGPNSPVDPAVLLRPGPVAGWLGVTTRTLANWAAAGKIPFHRTERGHLRFLAEEMAPAVAAMGRVVPPLPASIAGRQRQGAVVAVVDPPDSPASAAEPNQPDEDEHPGGQARAGHTPTASVEVGAFLVKQRFSGACDQATAELFFDEGHKPGRVRSRHQAAKAICALCPILLECRLVGRSDPSLEGIWGGETRDERRRARGGLPTPGNPNGRLLAHRAFQHAQRAGLHAAADRAGVLVATLRRVFTLYGLDRQADTVASALTAAGGKAGHADSPAIALTSPVGLPCRGPPTLDHVPPAIPPHHARSSTRSTRP